MWQETRNKKPDRARRMMEGMLILFREMVVRVPVVAFALSHGAVLFAWWLPVMPGDAMDERFLTGVLGLTITVSWGLMVNVRKPLSELCSRCVGKQRLFAWWLRASYATVVVSVTVSSVQMFLSFTPGTLLAFQKPPGVQTITVFFASWLLADSWLDRTPGPVVELDD